ncbi:major facilitator superfamily domain-containing protein [Neohortaea acidophila]|uniref:Major facilitator superfamily domain-containing protein n=1 Tax=Neohortaea acidophila TaxID=245834 RepID=A0A6A6PV42_9PEZI|nr:major facilitator superfamily domain-containing protein [Neohortaea acidophila]KAF2483117.1 major facilitator superfamily domain-containing protein [Neohortaea acidophila]
MSAFTLAGAIHFLSDETQRQTRVAHTPSRSPTNDELDAIELPDYGLVKPLSRPEKTATATVSNWTESQNDGAATPKPLSDLEQSRPPTPTQEGCTGVVPSWWYPKMNKWRHLSACLQYFGDGLNDAAPGALIPYIESDYHIGYAVVSLIWISNAVGFVTAAFFAEYLDTKLKRARCLMLSEVFLIAAYVVIACPVPFPVVVIAYGFLGFGEALNIALNNVFCANLANSTVVLGAAHGSYGIGGTLAPIIATALVSHGVNWHLFYIIPLAVRICCLLATGWAFWNYESEDVDHFGNSLVEVVSRQGGDGARRSSKGRSGIARALKNRTTLVGALFVFAYQGIEVSESGWFISYLIAYRHGNPKNVGYVTSGFWAGITVGRFVLTHAARWVGEKRFVFGLGVGVVVFQILAWQIPNVIGDSVAVSIIGLLLGPVYPCAQTIFTQLLPGSVQVSAIGFISSAGSSGGAVVPFVTGTLAQAVGTFVLHPVCIAFCVVMLGCWVGLPRQIKRTE